MSTHKPMTDKERQLFEAFSLAVEREREAQVTYGKMAAMAEDPKVREVFEQFQRQEANHERGILQLYESFKARMEAERK